MMAKKNSLWFKLLMYLSLSMIIMVASIGFILFSSMNLQNIAYQRFQEERYFQELQSYLTELQVPLQNYLTNKSSSALSRLLFLSETIREMVPATRPILNSESELKKREIYFLIDSYLSLLNQTIELKRGRKAREYNETYQELIRMYNHICIQIDELSLHGFRIQLAEYSNFLEVFRKLQLQNLLLVVVATLFAYSLLTQMAKNITTPMLKLSQMATQLSNGNFDIPDIEFSSINEVDQVANAFNQMKSSIHHYISELQKQKEMEQQIMTERLRNMKMEQLLKRMELYTMQAQMNPHFLFNTINTGVQLAILEEADKTAEFMENLADLFRFNIKEKKYFVPLRHEVEGLKVYYNILKIRFPKTLRLNLDVREDYLDRFSCPNMMLQPLVENSVLHAFKNGDGIGTVNVRIDYQDPILIISVSDDGIGMPEELVKELLTPHTRDNQFGQKVMGLENIIQRCYFFYPNQKDVIEIKSAPGEGTEIIIRLHTEVEPCIEL